jgi:hypothetical protein
MPDTHQIQNLTLEALTIQLPRIPTVHTESLIEHTFDNQRQNGQLHERQELETR